MLLGVVAGSSFVALSGATKSIEREESSIADSIRARADQLQELVSVISKKMSPDGITVEIINYGTRNITILQAFADGILRPFSLSDQDGVVFENNTIPPKKIMTVQIDGTGKSAQILTETKNIITLSS